MVVTFVGFHHPGNIGFTCQTRSMYRCGCLRLVVAENGRDQSKTEKNNHQQNQPPKLHHAPPLGLKPQATSKRAIMNVENLNR
jgi:hypothetical protein